MSKILQKFIYLATPLIVGAQSALADIQPEPIVDNCPDGKFCIPNFLPDQTVGGLIERVVWFLTLAAGSILVVVILVGAFQIMTSGGNPENVKKGRKTITWALIGFAIILLAGGLGSIVANLLGATAGVLDGTDVVSSPVTTAKGVINIINTIAGWMFGILMALGTIFVLYSAFLFLASGGDSEKVNTAKRVLIYAIVALVIGVLAGGAKSLVTNILNTEGPSKAEIQTEGGMESGGIV